MMPDATGLPLSLDFTPHPASSVAYIGFAGLALNKPMPDFALGTTLAALPVNRLLVRDVAQFWYLRGLAGISTDIETCATALGHLLKQHGVKQIVTVGASTGGYAALIYGALLGASQVFAFSPMTRLPSRGIGRIPQLLLKGHWTLAGMHINLRLRRDIDRRYCDLRPILSNDNGRTLYRVIYGDRHPADRPNAEHLAGLPRVTLDPRPLKRHDVAGALRESGELDALLASSLALLGLAAT